MEALIYFECTQALRVATLSFTTNKYSTVRKTLASFRIDCDLLNTSLQFDFYFSNYLKYKT